MASKFIVIEKSITFFNNFMLKYKMQPTFYKKQPKDGRMQPVEIIKLFQEGGKI